MSDATKGFGRKFTRYISELMNDTQGHVARQFEPLDLEDKVLSYELSDPLGEEKYSPLPRLVHRYPNRALILVTDICAVHCRYCFRRNFTGGDVGLIQAEEIDGIATYIAAHPEIDEVLLSGGDPLTATDAELSLLLGKLRSIRIDLLMRICTRIPGVNPSRITDELVSILAAHRPVWLVFQINHPDELTPDVGAAISKLLSAGIPVVSQTVLLRDVNDDPDSLAKLFHGLTVWGVKPYYLFQGDLASGTSHFRVPLRKSIEIVHELRSKVSNLALPQFAVDLPGGGGKIPLGEHAVKGPVDGWYTLTGPEGETGRYPDEDESK